MSIDHEMERVGRILAADQSLQVHVRGTQAYSTPSKVVIPNLRTWAILGREAKRMLHGLLDHETGHARLTDHRCMQAAHGDEKLLRVYGIDPERAKPFIKFLPKMFNAVEDGWMEQRQGRDWPGAKVNMDRKNQWFWTTPINMGKTQVPPVPVRLVKDPPLQGFILAVTMISRKAKTIDDLLDFPKVGEMVEHSRDLIEAIDRIDNSPDALRLALLLCERIRDRFEPEPEPESDGEEGDGDGDGDSADDFDDGSSGDPGEEGPDSPSEGSDQENDPQGPGDEESPQGGAGGEDEDDSEDCGSSGSGDEEGDPAESEKGVGEDDSPVKGTFTITDEDWTEDPGRCLTPEDSINVEIETALAEADDDYLVFSHEWDLEVNLEGRGDFDPDGKVFTPLAEIAEEAERAEAPLMQAFEAALRARKEMRPIAGCDEGEVDTSMIAPFSMGAAQPDEIFMQYVQEDDRDTAVSILVDCSGSMASEGHEESKAHLAARAVYSMSRALSAVQIPHEVLGFTCADSRHFVCHSHAHLAIAGMSREAARRFAEMRDALREAKSRGIDIAKFRRDILGMEADDIDNAVLALPVHSIFKGYSNDDLSGLRFISGIHENADGESILWAARRLAARPEPRRVLMVLSDGEPTFGGRGKAVGFLHRSIANVVNAGIEVCGIGMKTRAVRRFYPQNVVVQDMDDLGHQALTTMTEVLTEARQEHSWANLE